MMDVDLVLCMAACHSINGTGTRIGNESYDLECLTRCSQRQTTLFANTTEK